MKKTRLILSALLVGCCTLCSTAFIGANIVAGGESSTTVEYKMGENQKCRTYYLIDGCDSFDSLLKKLGDQQIGSQRGADYIVYKKLYLKGYDNYVFLVGHNSARGNTSNGVRVYTKIRGKIVCIGEIGSTEKGDAPSLFPICKSNGMLIVKNGDLYERYGVLPNGEGFTYYGLVKPEVVKSAKPLIFDRMK